MRFVAGRGAVAKRHRENAGRSAVAKRLAALWRIAIRKMLPAGRCAKDKDREDADDRELPAGSCIRERHQKAASGSHTAAKGRWQGSSSGV